MDKPVYIVGVDLGQSQDYTATVVLERVKAPDPDDPAKKVPVYNCRFMERAPLGTSYVDICDRLAQLFAVPPLKGSRLIIDQTGVGKPVVDLSRRRKLAAALSPVVITAGHAVTAGGDGSRHVPKRELVSVVQVLLQSRRLKVAPALAEAATLVAELKAFSAKITPAMNEVYGSWRTGALDDLVLGLALAAWYGERIPDLGVMRGSPVLRDGLQPIGRRSPGASRGYHSPRRF